MQVHETSWSVQIDYALLETNASCQDDKKSSPVFAPPRSIATGTAPRSGSFGPTSSVPLIATSISPTFPPAGVSSAPSEYDSTLPTSSTPPLLLAPLGQLKLLSALPPISRLFPDHFVDQSDHQSSSKFT
ncbi:hypothetical protein NCS57_01478600 [Fusarium keratoplasticum]|uniref:Uncharacterized protein n=1 Tax=Fusarium keratoplasticum TaxID=1328300 RepID=A0ACC0QEC4_9HYPO|nr:hypothetical protein NCS57_01478600 [Fusarium keratoplasticum]KAI8648666.1 hypothetical protein NCS57_01478600 [Fusarium keratoplasticum]